MKKNNFVQGGHPRRLDDQVHAQNAVIDNALHWAKAQQAPNNSFILEGCIITQGGGNDNVTAGSVVINGEICPVEAHSVATVGGQTLYWFIEETFTPINPRNYEDATVNNVNAVRNGKLAYSASPPAGYLAGDGVSYQELQESLIYGIGEIRTLGANLAADPLLFDPITKVGIGRRWRNWQLCYGAGVADLRGASPVGVDPLDGDFSFSATGGEKTHIITEAESWRHGHRAEPPATDPQILVGGASGVSRYENAAGAGTSFTGVTGIDTDLQGGGQPHNNMHPYQALTMIQKIS